MPPVLSVLIAVIVAFVAEIFVATFAHRAARRQPLALAVIAVSRRPLKAALAAAAAWIVLGATTETTPAIHALETALLIAVVLAVAWLLGAVALRLEDAAMAHHQAGAALARHQDEEGADPHALALQTRVRSLLRGATRALFWCLGVGSALLVFPVVRPVGVGLLALVAVAAVVLGLAAREVLADVVAGVRIAYTDSVRVGDVLVVDGDWGVVEAVTLTTVTVRLADGRRVAMPTAHAATSRVENRTRGAGDAVVGTVELDVDGGVDLAGLRAALQHVLDGTRLWDGRVGRLQVAALAGSQVRVRAVASAVDGATLLELREHVREELVGWLLGAQATASGLGGGRAGAWSGGSGAATSSAWRQTAAAIATPTRAAEPQPTAEPQRASVPQRAVEPQRALEPQRAVEPAPAVDPWQPDTSRDHEAPRLPERRSAMPSAAAPLPTRQAPQPEPLPAFLEGSAAPLLARRTPTAPPSDPWSGGGAAVDQTQVLDPAQVARLYDDRPGGDVGAAETQVFDTSERRSSRRELRDY
ncbi:mechanosensitive ion channel [Cellulomonas cellasea]|uniref:mechanosensitive ion channel family protein n=1 Tax=Cellulomonas cellasea TaxID=43670 RepID=UPI0025A3EA41|nr:mechanosensitive ion channel domain-containing protein [Cellulomonas cellasea]MDM8086152.1 mechanosensitive ion channel [Cellulomonas cellasea]